MKCGGCWAILGVLAQYQFYILLTLTVSQCQDLQQLVCCHTRGIMITGLFVKMCLLPTSAHICLHKCTSDGLFCLLLHFSLVSSFHWCPQMKLHFIKNGFLHLLAPHIALTSKTSKDDIPKLNKLCICSHLNWRSKTFILCHLQILPFSCVPIMAFSAFVSGLVH